MIAEIGTPAGSSHRGEIVGHWLAGVVKRAFGCAAGSPEPGVHLRPCQSRSPAGGSPRPSHQGSPRRVSATFVKIVFRWIAASMFGLLSLLVPGATPKKPASGLMALRPPPASVRNQAMSSPTVQTL